VSVERYAVGDRLILFGPDRLADLREGDRVTATICELHNGPPLASFPAPVHEVGSDKVGLGVFADVVGHRQRTISYEQAKASLRLLALPEALRSRRRPL
jgi:hypothetical protein